MEIIISAIGLAIGVLIAASFTPSKKKASENTSAIASSISTLLASSKDPEAVLRKVKDNLDR